MRKRYRYIWHMIFERILVIIICIIGIECAIELYHNALSGEVLHYRARYLVQVPGNAILQGLVIIYGGLTIVELLIEYFIKDTVTTEVSIQDFECKDYMFELIKTSLLSIFLRKKRDPVCAYTMNVIVEDKREIDFFYMDESVLEDVREITKKRRRQDTYEKYPHFFEISNLVHYKYRFEITYLKHSHLVIQMKPLPKAEKRDPTYLPDDYVSLLDRVKNLYKKVKGMFEKK